MDFIKKNFVKLLLSAVMLTALILAFIMMLNAFGLRGAAGFDAAPKATKSLANGTLFVSLGIFIGALSVLTVAILSMFDKDSFSPFILIAAGLIAAILIIVGMIMGAEALKSTADSIKALQRAGMGGTLSCKALVTQYNSTVFRNIFYLISFGFVPAIFGMKKIFEKSDR